MSIAVIIPVLNEQTILPRTLKTLITMPWDQIIVVDGGSQDETMDRARAVLSMGSAGRFDLSIGSPGRARQMNTGAARADSEILVFLHADTELPNQAPQLIQAALQDAAVVGGRFDVQFPNDRGWAWVISRMMNLRSRWSGVSTGDQAIFVRRQVFDQMGGFSDIPLMEDIEFSIRLKKKGRIVALPQKVTTSFRRWEKHGPLRTILRMWILRLWYWLGGSPATLKHYYDAVR